MNKKTLTIIAIIAALLTFLFCPTYGQNKWWKPSKNELIGYSAMLISGTAKGFNQAILYRNFGNGNSFWDKDLGWKRKYKNWPTDQSEAYFLSKSVLAFTTDGQHLTYTLNTTFLTAGTVFITWNLKQELKEIPKKDRWKYILFRKIILPMAIRSAAFELTFNNL